MELFRRIFFAAVLAGAVAGLVHAGLQQWRVVPLIIEAEAYETADHDHGAPVVEQHAHPDGAVEDHAHDEPTALAAGPWAPADGWERAIYTTLATVLIGIGFAFVIAAISVGTAFPLTPVTGIFWGLAGFAAFSLSPAMGLPPELPGMPAADLVPRQIWWWTAVLTTGAAALLVAQFRTWWAIAIAIVLVAAPHVFGAPAAADVHSDVPAHLATAFAANALGVSLIFWLLCGSLYGWLSQRFVPEEI